MSDVNFKSIDLKHRTVRLFVDYACAINGIPGFTTRIVRSVPEMNGSGCHLFFGLCAGFGIALH